MGVETLTLLKLVARDDKGFPSPFRAEIQQPGCKLQKVWSADGAAAIELAAAPAQILVSRGFDHDAVALEVNPASGESLTREVTLRRRFNAPAMGWYGGDSHAHVIHDDCRDKTLTIAKGAKIAAADGLDYIQFAWYWDHTAAWLPPEELNRQCKEASTPSLHVAWNIETPKCYMSEDDGGKSGNLHCFGHGWTVALKDNSRGHAFFHTGPNFKIIQEIHRQGAIVGCAHPMRYWFIHGNFVSNWPSELPFDFVAGAGYDAVDILNDTPNLFFESERFWYTLLNMGYKVAGTGNSDSCLERRTGLGRYRTYTQIDGGFSYEKLAQAMREGRNVASSGPFVLFDVDGCGPGSEFKANGRVRRATIRAWSSPRPGETLSVVQVIRNGEVVKAWDLHSENLREWQTSFELRDDRFAWYCVRVLSSCKDTVRHNRLAPPPDENSHELAVANPVYFLPEGFQRPRPTPARVKVRVTDADSGRAIDASVTATDNEREVAQREHSAGDECVLEIPGTSYLKVTAAGYASATRCLYMDCPQLFEYCRSIGAVYPSFFSPDTYHELRRRLANLEIQIALKREPH